jgi:hypothetical protein
MRRQDNEQQKLDGVGWMRTYAVMSSLSET